MTLFSSLIPQAARKTSEVSSRNSEQHPTLKPLYEVSEKEDAWGLTVYLPGVAKEGLDFSVDSNEVKISARRAWKQPSEWTALYRESQEADYELVLSHENSLDAEKIHAELKEGVLRVSLPKAAAIKPRKITVG
jgi:HSP20 family molecular chaperone IbpA